MNSLDWSDEKKKPEKQAQFFIPNIYRKPIERDDDNKELKKDTLSGDELQYVPWGGTANSGEKKQSFYKISKEDIDDIINKETVLSKIKEHYESEIAVYEEKNKEVEDLKVKLYEQKKELEKKCVILSSSIKKAAAIIPKETPEDLEKDIEILEIKHLELQKNAKELEDSKLELQKDLAEYNLKKENFSSLNLTYESELKQYRQKKAELDEKCRDLEEKITSGDDIPFDIDDPMYPAAIKVIRAGYYAELKALKSKYAEIESIKLELEDQEQVLAEKRSSIGTLKEQINAELIGLGPKTEELEASLQRYDKKLKAHKEKETSLQEDVNNFERKKEAFESEQKTLRLEYEEKLKVHTEKEFAFQEKMKVLEEKNAALVIEEESILSKSEENKRLEEDIERNYLDIASKKKELEGMLKKTKDEIGLQVTIHRQHLDIKKLNSKLEQQAFYIQNLEVSVADLKRSLGEARNDVKQNEVFSHILKQNLELIGL